ncbi:DNA gyrase inhibitor YacG [Pararhodobacter sp. SW119]|uniref:DNA gyrase inhibitor YacG n=1 Tax=Pararhodobacter sp. SW119 TaxID=2780075 RepID=UPI001ADFB4EF
MSRAAKCPVCRKPTAAAYRPFCSRRCADVDLARWFREDYVIPGRNGEAASDLVDPDERDDT